MTRLLVVVLAFAVLRPVWAAGDDLDFSLGDASEVSDEDSGDDSAQKIDPQTSPSSAAGSVQPASGQVDVSPGPPPILAQNRDDDSTATGSRRILASLVVLDPSLPPQRVAELEHILRQALLGRDDVEVLDLRRALDSTSGSDAQRFVADAQARLEAGKQAYDNLEAEAAIEQLTLACDRFEAGYAAVDKPTRMVEAHVYLASVLLQTGNEPLASKHYRVALYLNPKLELDPNRFSPVDIDALEATRRAIIQEPGGSTAVSSAPVSARVYIDGAYRGATPLTVSSLPPGDHFLRVERDGYEPIAGLIEIRARRSESFEQNLIAQRGFADLQRALASIDANDMYLGGQIEAIAKLLPGDGFVLLTARMADDGVGLKARVHEVDYARKQRLRHVDGHLPLNPVKAAPALRALVDQVLDRSRGEESPGVAELVGSTDGEPLDIPWLPILAGTGGAALIGAVAYGTYSLIQNQPPPEAPLTGGRRMAVLGY